MSEELALEYNPLRVSLLQDGYLHESAPSHRANPLQAGARRGRVSIHLSPMETALARDRIEVTLAASLQLLDAYESDRGVEENGSPCITL